MSPWVWVVIVIVIVIVLVVGGVARSAMRRRRAAGLRTAELRRRFGPEYDRAVGAAQDRRSGEEDLAELVSVDHPDVVENYRVAHRIFLRSQTRQASTEDLREALVRYRSMFTELQAAEPGAAPAAQPESRPEADLAAAEAESQVRGRHASDHGGPS